MDFHDILPGEETFCDDKATPSHIFSVTHGSPPPCSTLGAESEPPKELNVKWTAAHCARYDFFLHIASLVLSTPTLTLYSFDVAKSRSYHVKLPVGLAVIDALSITFLCLCIGFSLYYLLSDMHTRMARGDLGRKWPTIIDAILHTCLTAMADTTLSMRSGNSNCGQNDVVGGCDSWRQSLMIAAGVLMIVVALMGQVRWAVTMHAVRERKKLRQVTAPEATQNQDICWSNEIR